MPKSSRPGPSVSPAASPGPPRVAVVVSRYNESITGALLAGAVEEYARRGGDPEQGLAIIDAPGSFELPGIALVAAASEQYAAVVAIGCIVRGETSHDRYLAESVALGLMGVTTGTGVPVSFGVLTVDSVEQARARAGGDKGNKGSEAMAAALDSAAAVRAIEQAARERRPNLRFRIAGASADKAAPVGAAGPGAR